MEEHDRLGEANKRRFITNNMEENDRRAREAVNRSNEIKKINEDNMVEEIESDYTNIFKQNKNKMSITSYLGKKLKKYDIFQRDDGSGRKVGLIKRTLNFFGLTQEARVLKAMNNYTNNRIKNEPKPDRQDMQSSSCSSTLKNAIIEQN